MKNKIILTIACMIFLVFILLPLTSARKGVGIIWMTEQELVGEGLNHCITYGLYNPWDEDVTAALSVSSEFEDIITKQESETRLIKAGTFHDNSIPVELCFKIKNVYNNDCLVGNVVCEQTCKESEVSYQGNVIATEKPSESSSGGTGSATSLGISVPLKIRVQCNPYARDWTVVYMTFAGAAVLLILLVLSKKLHKKRKR